MGLHLHLGTDLVLECSVCKSFVDERRVRDAVTAVKLFGSANLYALCPGCLQDTTWSTRHDPEFRRKARVKMFELYRIVAREG
jgi:hypothetical protein